MSDLAVIEMLPPAPGPHTHGEPQSPVPPSARIAPASATRAASACNASAPPPFAPMTQHVDDPPPPEPKSDGSTMEPYVAFVVLIASCWPRPACEPAALSAPVAVEPPVVMPRGELLSTVASSLPRQAPR